MDSAGIIPEEDLQEDEAEQLAPPEEISEEAEQRLSVFEDFLEQLDLEQDDDEGEDDHVLERG